MCKLTLFSHQLCPGFICKIPMGCWRRWR